MPDQPRARHAVRVTDRYGTTIDIQDLVRDAELVAAIEYLDGESFIEFPKVDVVHRKTAALEQPGYGEYGANTHFIGLAADDGSCAVDTEWLEAAYTTGTTLIMDGGATLC